jgi:hypothetical protein
MKTGKLVPSSAAKCGGRIIIAISGPMATDFGPAMTLTGNHLGKHQERIFSWRKMVNPLWWMFFRRFRVARLTLMDCVHCQLRAGMDATRISDGKQVMLKKVLPEEGPHELSITRYFSSNELRDDPHNHCVPLLDLIDTADTKLDNRLMVLPFLRPFNHPHFQTFGEFVAFFAQICEVGLRKRFLIVTES